MSIAIGASPTASFTVGSSTQIVSAASALVAGNLNVVGVRYSSASQSGKQMFDTAGNRYLLSSYRKEVVSGGGTGLELWYCENCLGHASNVVTLDLNAAGTNRGIVIAQFSGLAVRFPFDTAASGHDSARHPATGTFDIHNLGESLVIGIAQVNATGGTWTPAAGYTKAVEDASGVMALTYRIVSGTFTGVSVDATSSAGSGESDIVVTVFRDPTTVDAGGGSHASFGMF